MWNERRGALRACAELRKRKNAVICPAHALAAARRFSLGNTHTISISTCSIRPRRIFGPALRCLLAYFPSLEAGDHIPLHTTDVAERREQYPPGCKASSRRCHYLLWLYPRPPT